MAAPDRGSSHPLRWTEEQLADWLTTRGLPREIGQTLESHQVNGFIGSTLTEDGLVCMGITDLLHRRRVFLELRHLFNNANAKAQSSVTTPQSSVRIKSTRATGTTHRMRFHSARRQGQLPAQTSAQYSCGMLTARRPRPRSANVEAKLASSSCGEVELAGDSGVQGHQDVSVLPASRKVAAMPQGQNSRGRPTKPPLIAGQPNTCPDTPSAHIGLECPENEVRVAHRALQAAIHASAQFDSKETTPTSQDTSEGAGSNLTASESHTLGKKLVQVLKQKIMLQKELGAAEQYRLSCVEVTQERDALREQVAAAEQERPLYMEALQQKALLQEELAAAEHERLVYVEVEKERDMLREELTAAAHQLDLHMEVTRERDMLKEELMASASGHVASRQQEAFDVEVTKQRDMPQEELVATSVGCAASGHQETLHMKDQSNRSTPELRSELQNPEKAEGLAKQCSAHAVQHRIQPCKPSNTDFCDAMQRPGSSRMPQTQTGAISEVGPAESCPGESCEGTAGPYDNLCKEFRWQVQEMVAAHSAQQHSV